MFQRLSLDLGLLQMRKVVHIPVVFAGETSFHIACLLAYKFSLLAYSEAVRVMGAFRNHGYLFQRKHRRGPR